MTNPPSSTIFAAPVRKQIDSGANHASAPIAKYKHRNDTHRLRNNQAAKITIIHSEQCAGNDMRTQYNYKLSVNMKPPPCFRDKSPSSGKRQYKEMYAISIYRYIYIFYIYILHVEFARLLY